MHTIGIDFGTTKTLVSHINPRTGQPEPLRLGRETHLLPTTIYIDANGHYYFGDDADDMIEEATGCYIRGFKMKLGSDAPMHLLPDGSRIFARDLVREYLHFIRKKVEELVYHGEQITKATITRPVKFSPAQCMELEQAAKVAGFQQVEFTTEPEAAGLAYCRLNASHAFTRNALVVDWGGGTLDFALVTRHEGTVRTHANLTDGDTSMGGEKFDNLLWNYVEQAAMRLNVDYLDYVTQLPRVRRAKEVLSTQQNFTLRLSSAAGACPPIPLSRGEFNKLIEADVTKAAEKVQALIQRIPVELKPEMLLLVGGSSQIPLIKEQLEAVCHLPAMRWQYSREAVALGAALTSYILVDAQTLCDRAEQYCEQNRIEEAASLYHRAAEAGCADAQFFLALCYTIDKNLINALSRLQEAEEAQGEDGVLEVLSDRWNENANQAEAAKWIRQAAEQEHAKAQYLLGLCYLNGTGVAQNPAEALKWLYAAAEQEHADAQYDLGRCYLDGTGVAQNPAEAVKWFRFAAEQGHARAQYALGACYVGGIGVEQNMFEAAKWIRQAAEQEHAEAQYRLGCCYLKGIGVSADQTEAVKWISAAAEQEHAEAQYLLGFCYLKGIGVSADQTEAVKWISAAAEQGLEEARDFFHSNEQNFACSICQNILTTTCHEATCSHCGSTFRWNSGTGRWNLINERKKQQSTASSHKKVPAHNQPGNPANQKKDEEKSNDLSGCIITAVVIIVVWILLVDTGLGGPVVAIGTWIAVIWAIFDSITKKK